MEKSKINELENNVNLNNSYYFYVNTTFLSPDKVINMLNGKDVEDTDNGFMNKKTVFKIGDIK